LRWLLLWMALAGFPLAAFGAGEGLVPVWKPGSEPLQVESKSLEAFGEGGRVVFEGDVMARQGDLTLQADRVEVHVKPDTREIRSVEARGSVRIQRGDLVASGEAASYDARSGVMVLTGDPKVWRGKDVLAGEKITLYLGENRIVVEGARAVLSPGEPKGEKSP